MELSASLARSAYQTGTKATAPEETAAGRVAGDFFRTLQQGEATAMASLGGGADSQALVEALAQTEIAVEAATTVRDRVVEAYQEILRMPV